MALQIGRSPRLKAAYLAYAEADAQIKDATARKDAAKRILDEARGEHTTFTLAGATVLSIAQKSRQTIDGKGLKAAHPILADAFTRTTTYNEWSLKK